MDVTRLHNSLEAVVKASEDETLYNRDTTKALADEIDAAYAEFDAAHERRDLSKADLSLLMAGSTIHSVLGEMPTSFLYRNYSAEVAKVMFQTATYALSAYKGYTA